MEIYPSGLAILGLVALAARDPDRVAQAAIALLPLGMLAALKLPIGGMTPLISYLVAAMALALMALRGLTTPGLVMRAPAAGLPLLLFAVYAVFSALFLVRLFAGDFLVFSFSRGIEGVRVSHAFPATMIPLRPGPANISQTGYLMLSVAMFFVASDIARRRGGAFLLDALRAAAAINVVFGVLDALGLDPLLEIVRTAQYILHNEQVVAGLPRVIGAFPEASGFGAMSIGLAAILLSHGLAAGVSRDVTLGLINAGFGLAAVSSTAIIGFFVMGAVVFSFGLLRFGARQLPARAAYLGCAAAFGTAAALGLWILWSAAVGGGLVDRVLQTLIFSKSDSASGLERGALAWYGLVAFVETYGLGAGVGSVRANGFLSAAAATVGAPGLILFAWFTLSALRRRKPEGIDPAADAHLVAARTGAATILAMSAASSMSADPGLLFMVTAALGAAASASGVARRDAPAGDGLART